MLNKTNTLVVLTFAIFSTTFLAAQSNQGNLTQAQLDQPPAVTAQYSLSRDATEEETERLLREAERLLNSQNQQPTQQLPQIQETQAQQPQINPQQAAAAALAQQNINDGQNTSNTSAQYTQYTQAAEIGAAATITDPSTATLPAVPASAAASDTAQPGYTINKALAVFYSWVPGLGAVIVCFILLIMVKSEFKRNREAALDASQLISDINDLETNIKEWELENHYNHISEISEHIDALETAVDTAKDERHHIDTSISTSIELNKKSLDILKRANKELSKSLINQVQELETQLNQVIEEGIIKINTAAEEQSKQLNIKKDEILSSMNSSAGTFGASASTTASKAQTPVLKQQPNWMDLIKAEMAGSSSSNSATSSSTFGTASHSSAALDHASMLRESIERQKAILGQRKKKEDKPESKPKEDITKLFSGLKSSSLLNDKITETTKIKPEENNIIKKSAVNTQDTSADFELNEIKNTLETKTAKPTPEAQPKEKKQELDETKLKKKLEYAQKWNNFADAAEICSQLSEITPASADVYDTWGQMLARHAGEIKGNEGTELLKQANKKMHKASMLDSSNYKIFNNWGVILKNLALTYSNTHEIEKTLALARRKFETSISLNANNHEALSNWGNALVIQARYRSGSLQESLLEKACEKFEQSIKIKHDKANTLHSWGNALFRLANCKKNPDERNKKLQEANAKWEMANKLKPGIASKEMRVLKSMVPPLSKTTPNQKHSLLNH